MRYRVRITRMAAHEVKKSHSWLAERIPDSAQRWRTALLSAIESLASQPDRCPEAPEAEWYGPQLRQLLHGRRPHVYRILFEIRGKEVVILRVRHSRQDLLSPEDM